MKNIINKTEPLAPMPLVVLDSQVYRANFVWDEEPDYIVPKSPYHHRYYELSALLPFAMMLLMATLIFILIVFRRWPSLVAGIIAGFLTSISIYLLLLTLKEERIVYE